MLMQDFQECWTRYDSQSITSCKSNGKREKWRSPDLLAATKPSRDHFLLKMAPRYFRARVYRTEHMSIAPDFRVSPGGWAHELRGRGIRGVSIRLPLGFP